MTPFNTASYFCLLLFFATANPISGKSVDTVTKHPTEPSDTIIQSSPLGHLMCTIRADTNCLDHTVTLEAWIDWTFTGVSEPITAPWSNGVTAHKIVVEPPGVWSWEIGTIGCEPVHQFNTIAIEQSFFDGPIVIDMPNVLCPSGVELSVNSGGYPFASFSWMPGFTQLSPNTVTESGLYALTVTDALGCTSSDAVQVNIPGGTLENCFDACVYCDLDGFQGTNTDEPPQHVYGSCGQISLQNPMALGFVAGTDSITMQIVSSNCQSDQGLQASVLGNCLDKSALVCDPGCVGCDTLTLSFHDFTPGESYWLIIDGQSGDVCDFNIHVTQGSTVAPATVLTETPSGPTIICGTGTAVYSIAPVPGASFYHWSAPEGASINGGGNEALLSSMGGNRVTITFGVESGDVCVYAGNSCQPPTLEKCLSVSSNTLPPTTKPTLYVCQASLPYQWDEAPYFEINTPGTYQFSSTAYVSSTGCDSVVQQTVIALPLLVTQLDPIYLCAGECAEIGGAVFCEQGYYNQIFQSSHGCDSIVIFNIQILNPIANIIGPSSMSCDQDEITVTAQYSFGIQTWYDASGQPIGQGSELIISQAGTYIYGVQLSGGGVTCEQFDTIQVTAEQTIADLLITGVVEGCTAANPAIIGVNTNASDAQFLWSGPNGFTSNLQNPAITDPGLYTVTATLPNGCSGVAQTTINYVGGIPDLSVNNLLLTCAQASGQLCATSSVQGLQYFWSNENQGITSEEQCPEIWLPGEYQLIVTAPNGCTATAVATVELNGEIPYLFWTAPNIICEALPFINCSAPPNVIYSWEGPNGFVSNVQNPVAPWPGTYSVTVTNPENGCTNSYQGEIGYEEHDITISADFVNHPDAGQNNGAISITVSTGFQPLSFEWFYNGQTFSTNEDLSGLAAGTYTVVVTDGFGCTQEQTFELMGISGSNEPTNNSLCVVSPNPSAGLFELFCQQAPSWLQALKVYDCLGRLILQSQPANGENSAIIDLEIHENGLYFLELNTLTGRFWAKLNIQK